MNVHYLEYSNHMVLYYIPKYTGTFMDTDTFQLFKATLSHWLLQWCATLVQSECNLTHNVCVKYEVSKTDYYFQDSGTHGVVILLRL